MYVSSPDQSLIRILIVSLVSLQSWEVFWILLLTTEGASSTHFWGPVGLSHAKVWFLLEVKGIQEKRFKAIICLYAFSQRMQRWRHFPSYFELPCGPKKLDHVHYHLSSQSLLTDHYFPLNFPASWCGSDGSFEDGYTFSLSLETLEWKSSHDTSPIPSKICSIVHWILTVLRITIT